MLSVDEVLSRFDGVRQTGHSQWLARCPCHDDRKQSLSVSVGDTGAILITDHGGCNFRDVLSRVGLTVADVTPPKQERAKGDRGRFDFQYIVATYVYGDDLRKLRDGGKNFLWQHREGDKWKAGRGGLPHQLYKAGTPSDTVYIVEGEKDADTVAKRLSRFAVSSENGAGKGGKKWFNEYNAELSGKTVRIIQDNDEIGHQFAESVAQELSGVAKSVKLFDLKTIWDDLPPKGDISDLVDALGADRAAELLDKLEAETPEFVRDVQAVDNSAEVKKMLDMTVVSGIPVVAKTAKNYEIIFTNDNHFADLRFNILRGYPERVVNGKRLVWDDTDDALSRIHIEETYHLNSRDKYEDGIRAALHKKKYHPVQELISSFTWDGTPRCTEFLTRWMGAEDTPYNRECSRLIFSGGINRAFSMGCKFDEVVVLIGGQGGGKSTICQWLALEPDLYASLKTISGQRGAEGVSGVWICEIEELLAVLANDKAGSKTEENAKAFLSATADYYRKPYDHRPSQNLRGNIFIGTTNRDEFLTDKTGNRRWYPIRCNSDGRDLYQHKAECQAYIRQCWAEMLVAYRNGDALAAPVANAELLQIIKEEQKAAAVEDWRVGVIGEYLDKKNRTCVRELWTEALHPNTSNPPDMRRADSNDLAEILTHELGWVRGGVERFNDYGKQKAFLRPNGAECVAEEVLPF